MIAFLSGRIHDKRPNTLIVDVGGVGYEVHVPLSTFYNLGDEGAQSLRVGILRLRHDVVGDE